MICGLALSVDGFVERHLQEDKTIEMLGAFAFLFGAVMCSVAVLRGVGLTAVAVGILCFVAFLDEMSFGERHLGLEPFVINGVEIDAVHDLLQLSLAIVGDRGLWLAITIIIFVLGASLLLYMIRTSDTVRAVVTHGTMPQIAVALTLIAAAQIIDIDVGVAIVSKTLGEDASVWVYKSHFEEAAEFVAAILFLFAAYQLMAGPIAAKNKLPPNSVSRGPTL